jgi:SNF2 family DNA or RNA helicase/HJR/Mrr/RecB family endonuclease
MINRIYHNDHIEIQCLSSNNDLISYSEWLNNIYDTAFFNVTNDLLVNGVISISDSNKVVLFYDDLERIDKFEYETLKLPKAYPFDIYIDILGSGLKDLNLKLKYSFQDFAHQNGSGNIVFKNGHRTGAYLKNELEYLLNSDQFALLSEIDVFNETSFKDSNSVLKALSKIQELAVSSSATLSKVLLDTNIIAPEKIKVEIVKIGEDKYKLKPIVPKADNSKFQKHFEIFPRVKPEYSFKENDKKVRIVLNQDNNDSSSSLQSELSKLKRKNVYNGNEVNEIYNSPTKFWDTDIIDLNDFGERVFELGIYKPKFYPFISPYKSQWIPGVAIDDKKNGVRHLTINNKAELDELKNAEKQAKQNGNSTVAFKGENIDLDSLQVVVENAERQLNSPRKPVTNSQKEKEKPENQTKVLIIKENAEENDYTEVSTAIKDIKYSFHKISNLALDIKLKNHQEDGVAWLQTLCSEPYSLPGVLLADDMGLGKTIQVLYFIEWFFQNKSKKPVLVVAPVSLLENWQNEYVKFFPKPSMKVVTLWGANVKYYIIPNDKQQTITNLSEPAIYLTTYETLRKQQIPLGLIDWGNVILDEAQKVKTPGTFVTNAAKALKSDFKIAMTGTPVENSLIDLWCIIDFCSPGLLENAKVFSEQFQKPLKNENTDYRKLSEDLRSQIGDSLLRRMKSDVAKDLPSIDVFKLEESMPREQFDAYLHELSVIENHKKERESGSHILQGIFNLRSISDHPFLKHYQTENIDSDTLINTSAKLKRVISILSEIQEKKEKAIIFTENKSMQRILRRIISDHFSLNIAIINGETPTNISKIDQSKLTRQQEIDRYQEIEGFNVIIMSPVAAGFGLNVTGANHVIHYTRHWNPAKEQQATDRAYRIGQKKSVKVYYPLAVSPNNGMQTFDLILDELLKRKSNLASCTLFPTEQIEISKDDFVQSLNFDSTIKRETKLTNIENLDKLNPLSFEAAVALLLERVFQGNSFLTPKSNDKGADIVLFGKNKNFLVQVKQSLNQLGISSGQEIKYALPEYQKKHEKIFEPYVITNNHFSSNAIDMAEQNGIKLVDRETLKMWIKEFNVTLTEIDNKLKDRV